MTLSANHSFCLVFTNAFDRVLIFMRLGKADPRSFLELQGILGGLSANHIASFMCS